MANRKITEFTQASAIATDDVLLGVDISDTSESSTGTTKKFPQSVVSPTPSPRFQTKIARITAGGARQFGIPGCAFSSVGVAALSADQIRYFPFVAPYPLTITNMQLEVTAGPISDANARVAIYEADADVQPTGGPVYDSGNIAVLTSFTGLKSQTGLTIALDPGLHLIGINVSVGMTVRTLIVPTAYVAAAMGANALIQNFRKNTAFAAFASPGTKWDTISVGTGGQQHVPVFAWTDSD